MMELNEKQFKDLQESLEEAKYYAMKGNPVEYDPTEFINDAIEILKKAQNKRTDSRRARLERGDE